MDAMFHIPDGALIHVFRYLDAVSLIQCGMVCRQWREISRNRSFWNSIWSQSLYSLHDRINNIPEPENLLTAGLEVTKKQYLASKNAELSGIQESWDKLTRFLSLKKSPLLKGLRSGATEESICALEDTLGHALPADYRFSMSIFDGESTVAEGSGLFGEYSFYDQGESLSLLPSQAIAHSRFRSFIAQGIIPILICTKGNAIIIMFFRSNQAFSCGQIAYVPRQGGMPIVVAQSFQSYLKEYSERVVTGYYTTLESSISLWPPYDEGAITNGVRIQTSVKFVPQDSTIFERRCNYLFAYQIRITMDENEDPGLTCTLQSRHWKIQRAPGKIEVVDGPGVIGLFPTISPGSVFEYASCCPITSTTGYMEGHFQFSNNQTRQTFNATVARFELQFPY
eukprot:TRINITY_DN9636_c0_g1_i5.p1 TRINITY_DN9636_c0_g1~~TRINITY_DN9636_c0_g1_i5.p1  ORF type:complete len:396 (+),score=68.33 TRINITY_DN9636_c0_g1_i5:90-1277(+)